MLLQQRHDTQRDKDGGRLVASADGINWVVIEPMGGYPRPSVAALGGPGFSGRSEGWYATRVDLTPLFATLGRRFQLGFEFASDGDRTSHGGWAIDRIRVFQR